MDVVTMQGFIEDDQRDVGDAAKVNEVFYGQGPPYLDSVSED